MFSLNSNQKVETRVAVLEEKYSTNEKLMDKLENAIQTISEINQNLLRMLSVHEEKIDNNVKTDGVLFEKLKNLELKNTQEHSEVVSKLEKIEKCIEKKVDDESEKRDTEIKRVEGKISKLNTFRILILGGALVVTYIISNPTIVVDLLTDNQPEVTIEKVK